MKEESNCSPHYCVANKVKVDVKTAQQRKTCQFQNHKYEIKTRDGKLKTMYLSYQNVYELSSMYTFSFVVKNKCWFKTVNGNCLTTYLFVNVNLLVIYIIFSNHDSLEYGYDKCLFFILMVLTYSTSPNTVTAFDCFR